MNDKKVYKVIFDSQPPRIVRPINDKEVIFTHEKPDDDKVFFNKKLKNKIEFSNVPKEGIDDFDYFYAKEANNFDRCKEFLFHVYRICKGEDNRPVEILEWEGKFSLNDGDWDLDRCTFVVKPEPDTPYQCIKNNKSQEVNILDIPNIITTTANLDYAYEFYYCAHLGGTCSFPGVQTATWTLFYQALNYQYIKDCNTYNVHLRVYYREAIVTACVGGVPNPPPGSGWLLETNNCGINSTAKYVRVPVAGTLPFATSCAVGWYNFLTSQDEPPPFPKFKTVTVSNAPPSEGLQYKYTTIVGAKASGGGGIDPEWFMEVPLNPNSTYAWSLSPSSLLGATVTGTTNEVSIIPNSPFNVSGVIIIRLTETHGNASVSIKDYSITYVGLNNTTPNTIISQATVLGPATLCKSATLVQYSIPKQPVVTTSGFFTPTISAIVWTVTGGAVITAGQGTRTVTITAPSGLGAFTVKASWSVSVVHGTTPSNNYTFFYENTKSIIVAELPETDDIFTIINRYPSEPGLFMSVQARVGASYAWYEGSITSLGAGGTIFGRNFMSVTPASLGPHCYLVKESLNCSCANWKKVSIPIAVPIPFNAAGYFPPVYWCQGASTSGIVFNRNRSFKESVEYVVSQMGCGISSVVSDFFEWNPPGDTPGYVAGVNYVTGNPNLLTNITIAQKSDIISYSSSNKATKGLITFDKLEKIWAHMYQAFWFIDQFNRLRIEHISWFTRSVAYNANVAPHSDYNIAKNKYSYDKAKMPKFEVFKHSEMMFTDFVGTAIYYDSICVDQNGSSNRKENFLDFVTTDLYSLYLDPASANKVGFVLIANNKVGTTYSTNVETGAISGNLITNAHLSWANLHDNYFRHNRVLITGYLNNALTTFISARPLKQQKDIALKICCGDVFDPITQLYKTEIGNGELQDAEENCKTGIFKLNLLHG